MATVTGVTAEKIQELMDAVVTSGTIDSNGQLILKTRGGQEINAGAVIAPKAAVDKAYPVGSVYIGTTNKNPVELLGVGTWVRFANGRTLVGVSETEAEFDAVLETGGEKAVKLTTAQMPAHSHSVPNHTHDFGVQHTRTGRADGSAFNVTDVGNVTGGGGTVNTASTGGSGTLTSGSNGSNGSHNNLQPYITVYMWRRTA